MYCQIGKTPETTPVLMCQCILSTSHCQLLPDHRTEEYDMKTMPVYFVITIVSRPEIAGRGNGM